MLLIALKTSKEVGLKIREMIILLLFTIVSIFLSLLKISKAFSHLKNECLYYYVCKYKHFLKCRFLQNASSEQ